MRTKTLIASTCVALLLESQPPASAGRKVERVATVHSVLGQWNLISVDGAETNVNLPLSFERGAKPNTLGQVSTSDDCNTHWWEKATLDKTGELVATNGPGQTMAACRENPRDPVVVDTLKQPVKLRRVDSDLVLDGVHQLRFRMWTPTPTSPATLETITGDWSGSSLNDEPLRLLHVIQIGRRFPVESTRGPCAGLFVDNASLSDRGLLLVPTIPSPIPECTNNPDPRVVQLLMSQPYVEVRGQGRILRFRTPTTFAEFSTQTFEQTFEQPTVPLETSSASQRFPARPATPATAKSVAGKWNVVSINEMPAPPNIHITFPTLAGSDGCNKFWLTRSNGTVPVTFDSEGTLRLGGLAVTKKACFDVGFTWDPRMRRVFKELPTAEHVGASLVIRTPARPSSNRIWITLQRE